MPTPPYKLSKKLLKIKWQDRIPDTEVLKRAGMQSVHTLLKLAQLRWTGHVTRMPDERLPKKIFYGELQVGKRSYGGQKKRYKETIKASLRLQHTNRVKGTDCTGSYKVARPHKEGSWWMRSKKNQRSRAETCTAESKRNASPTELSSSDLSCSICNSQFRAKIDLISHLRTYK